MWGAQGNTYSKGIAGKGGYAVGYYNAGNVLYVCCGGKGVCYNGGGAGQCPGGDATHIAITTNRGVLANYKNNTSEILLVAGGGGGSNDIGTAGSGGGTNGGSGEQVTYANRTIAGATGGTQSSGGTFPGNLSGQVIVNGSFGQGGYGSLNDDRGGGGGGGWYGGGGTPFSGCGGGGSGHINTSKITNGSMQSGIQEGNGKALITWMPVL